MYHSLTSLVSYYNNCSWKVQLHNSSSQNDYDFTWTWTWTCTRKLTLFFKKIGSRRRSSDKLFIYITRVFTNQSLISYTNWRFSSKNSWVYDRTSDTNKYKYMLSTSLLELTPLNQSLTLECKSELFLCSVKCLNLNSVYYYV